MDTYQVMVCHEGAGVKYQAMSMQHEEQLERVNADIREGARALRISNQVSYCRVF